ncbi:uncharacterized protein HNQ50_004026 [Silvimonas terrae]|uniref:YecA family protein n=1 Tax=Silvimonas terrae TaxID=300266 RepID=A0A840RM57_9NEIS|nr:UPF0149 family protein [Silvimonas terrae]MBB5193272.1 uncharacterized protein [Silvimonas terrae]
MPSPKDNELLTTLTEAELDELATFLESDAAPIQSMDISMLHGFLTAQLVGPEELPPDTWFGLVWGERGEKPEWESRAQQERIEGLILRVYNHLTDELNAEPPSFTPLVYLDQERNLDIVQQWCYGFMLGTSLNPRGWKPMMDDEEAMQLISPILDCSDEEAREQAEAAGEDLAQFEHDLAAALPEVIPTIREYWQERTEARASHSTRGSRTRH